MSSTASFETASGWSSARRRATRAPLSCPTTAKRSNPSSRISSTWSCAIARFEYGSWLGSESGLALSPYPRRSGPTTWKRSASAGATRCHIACVCGYPCRSSTGGPSPPTTAFTVTVERAALRSENPENRACVDATRPPPKRSAGRFVLPAMDLVEKRPHDLLVQAILVGLGRTEDGLEEVDGSHAAAGGLDVRGAGESLRARDRDVPHPHPGAVGHDRRSVHDRPRPDPNVIADSRALQDDCRGRDVAAQPDPAPCERALR